MWIKERSDRVFQRRDGAEALAEFFLKLPCRRGPPHPDTGMIGASLGFNGTAPAASKISKASSCTVRYLREPTQFTWGIFPLVLRSRQWLSHQVHGLVIEMYSAAMSSS